MSSSLRDEVCLRLLEDSHLTREDPLVLGLSGGPDSLCLFDLLVDQQFRITVGHLDHSLRPESASEAVRLNALVTGRGVPFCVKTEDVRAHAKEIRKSVEEAGRDLRYQFLFDLARERGAKAVLVAHHSDDQVETILMHFLRGSGIRGLTGMRLASYLPVFSPDIPLVRPLLRVSKTEILDYCRERNLEPFSDETNRDTSLLRNRIRLELLPYLETYNPRLKDVLLRSAEVFGGEHELLRSAISSAWGEVVASETSGALKLRRLEFLRLHRALSREIFRKAVFYLSPDMRDLDFEAAERFIELTESPPRSGEADITSGLTILHEGEFVWLIKDEASLPQDEWPQLGWGEVLTLEIPGQVQLRNGWTLEANLVQQGIDLPRAATDGGGFESRIQVNADRLARSLTVRSRLAGDRIAPLGLDGKTQKVSDVMINRKVPRRVRDRWPLVLSGEEILWIPGHRVSEKARITTETRRRLELGLKRVGEE